MRIENFPQYFGIQQRAAQQAAPMDQLVSTLNQKMENTSPLEAARQALLDAKEALDQQKNERIENALGGYCALRSRQTSYESQLGVQQQQLDRFQTLSSRRDALSEELSSVRAEYENCAAAQQPGTLDTAECSALFRRVDSLEQELANVNQDISSLVEYANRYADSQRKYAAYLDQTGQKGYAAMEYQGQPAYTQDDFESAASSMIDRLETGVQQCRKNMTYYCQQCGLTPCDFESYLQERNKLGSACFAAQQRLTELLYAANGAAPGGVEGKAGKSYDTVEISAAFHKSFF